MNEDKQMVKIKYSDGHEDEVELVTYLFSEDQLNTYIVFSKGEKSGVDEDEVIYISKVLKEDNVLIVDEISDDSEWVNVQTLLKKIANA